MHDAQKHDLICRPGVADSSYTCVNITTNATVSQATCGLVATFNLTSAFEEIPNENFNISYGDGEYLNGVFGYETVGLAGINVSHQQIGVPYLAGWEGDNITSGLVGLAYPALTAAYSGTNASADNATDPENYSPIINTIFNVENLTEPVFSLSISRNPNIFGFGGYLTIGGIPNISDPSVNASNYFAVTPIEFLSSPRPVDFFTFYLIDVDEIVYSDSPGPNTTQFIVDSGTTINYFPTADADAINELFDPPAMYSEELGIYIVPCNATPPEVGVIIAGETFYHNPVDLIQNLELGPELCGSAILDGGDTLILGDTFLKNVLAVFDVGNSQMAFSSRMYYESESSN